MVISIKTNKEIETVQPCEISKELGKLVNNLDEIIAMRR